MPSDSIGFCVAITRKGSGTRNVSPPIVTWCSCMTSSSADCTFAGARLISSASRRLAKTGPSSVRNVPSPGCQMPRADEVRGDEVGRELDAPERAAEHGRERPHGQRLGQAGDALDQDVAAGEQGHEQALEHRVLADDDALALVERGLQRAAHLAGGVGLGNVGRAGHELQGWS